MRKFLLSLLLLISVGINAKDYKVSTAIDFIKALKPNRTVVIQGIINLSDVLENDYLCEQLGIKSIR